MRGRLILILGLLAVFLSVTAQDCVLETKEIEVPARDDEDVIFTTTGGAEHSGSETVDFKPTLLDVEDDSGFDVLVSAAIESGSWKVDENRGDTDLVISGSVTVTRLNPGKTGVRGAAQPATLITYTSVPIASVTGAFQVAPLESGGLGLLNQGFQEYFNARNAQLLGENVPLPDLQYRFDWQGVATSSNPQPNVDFDWQAKVRFVLTGIVEVDVPELF